MPFVLQLQPVPRHSSDSSAAPSLLLALEQLALLLAAGALEQLEQLLPSMELLLLSLPGSSASESLSDELFCFRFFAAFLSLPLFFAFFRSLSFFFLLFALASFFDPFFFFFFVAFLS